MATSFTLNSGGSFTYKPAADFNGTDSFTYQANDGRLDSDAATVIITVAAVNDAPTVAVAAGGQCGTSGTSGQINLTVADVESAASALTLSATSGADIIFGKNGNDTINVQDGNDLLCGGNDAGVMTRLTSSNVPARTLPIARSYSTVTLLARLRGLSTSRPRLLATW